MTRMSSSTASILAQGCGPFLRPKPSLFLPHRALLPNGPELMDIRDQEITFSDDRPVSATSSQKAPSKNRWSAKHAFFFVFGLMTLFVLYHNETFFLDRGSGTWKYFYPVLGKLMVHALGGATALCLGALQFSRRVRQRYPKIHRVSGRFYVAGVLAAAPMAVYLSFTHGIRTMSTEITVQSAVWALTTLMAR